MSERLNRIWAGFEAATTRNLAGRGVENIVLPHRGEDAPAMAEPTLPPGLVSPADAAFKALKVQLAAAEKKARSGGKKRRGPNAAASAAEEPYDDPFSLDARAHDPCPQGAPPEVVDMIRGMTATEMRVDRPHADYAAFLAVNARTKLRGGKRKKFLGIF